MARPLGAAGRRRPAAPMSDCWGPIKLDAVTLARSGFELRDLPTGPGLRRALDLDLNLHWDGFTWMPTTWWVEKLRATTPGAALGTNAPKLYELEDAPRPEDWNAAVESVQSSVGPSGGTGTTGLGVRFLRQPGPMDLFWDPDQMSVPVDTGEIPDRIGAAFDRATWLGSQLAWADTAGCPVVLTFLTLGVANGRDAGRDPFGEFANGSTIRLTWDDAHLYNSLGGGIDGAPPRDELGAGLPTLPDGVPATPDPRRVAFRDEFRTTQEQDWGLSSLDPRSAYHREYVEALARQTAIFLEGVVRPARARGGLLAVELFNEVNSGNVVVSGTGTPDPAQSGRYWGQLLVRAVRGFVAGYEELGFPENLPDLWWTSLASPRAEQEYDYVVAFHAALVRRAVRGLGRTQPEAIDPAEVLVNQDLHFYRFTSTQGARPIAELYRYIERIRQNFGDEGLSGVTISVCETGASAEHEYGEYPGYVDSGALRELFQARETIRRASVAIAAGASRVGWNALFSKREGDFEGCGLLRDYYDVNGRDVEFANQANSRHAYWTWQALGTLFDDAIGTLRWPDPSLGDDLMALDTSAIEQMVVVVELYVRGVYLYVAFVDSVYSGNGSDPVELTFSDPSGSGVTATIRDPIPEEIDYAAFPEDESEYPADAVAAWPADDTLDLRSPQTLTLSQDMDPLLLESPVRLDIDVDGVRAPAPPWRRRVRP